MGSCWGEADPQMIWGTTQHCVRKEGHQKSACLCSVNQIQSFPWAFWGTWDTGPLHSLTLLGQLLWVTVPSLHSRDGSSRMEGAGIFLAQWQGEVVAGSGFVQWVQVSGPGVSYHSPYLQTTGKWTSHHLVRSMPGSRTREDAGTVPKSCMDTVCMIPCGQMVPIENSASSPL